MREVPSQPRREQELKTALASTTVYESRASSDRTTTFSFGAVSRHLFASARSAPRARATSVTTGAAGTAGSVIVTSGVRFGRPETRRLAFPEEQDALLPHGLEFREIVVLRIGGFDLVWWSDS